MVKFLHDALKVDEMWYTWIVFAVLMDALIVGLAIINIIRDNEEEEKDVSSSSFVRRRSDKSV